MLKNILKERDLPPFLKKEEMLDILFREEYGYMPPKPAEMTWELKKHDISNYCAGKADLHKVELTCRMERGDFSFPVYVSIPRGEGKYPFFVMINFRDNVPDRYLPSEELVDNGFAVLSFCYKDVTSDDGDFTNGLAGILYENGKRGDTDPGKIAMWAWAAQRVMDYAQSLDCLDYSRSCVCGHSRLGKTAMLTAATDERFTFAHSNNSGCSGAAITRDKVGERVADICDRFPFWFCENYKKYAEKEHEMPFDQHYLAACIAPRYLYVASAVEDTWADPESEMLTCVATSEVYEAKGLDGFVCEDRPPRVGDIYHKGHIGYHLRSGLHYFSREDWQRLIEFINSKD